MSDLNPAIKAVMTVTAVAEAQAAWLTKLAENPTSIDPIEIEAHAAVTATLLNTISTMLMTTTNHYVTLSDMYDQLTDKIKKMLP